MREAAIRLKDISKTYRIPSLMPWVRSRRVEALHEVNFSCPAHTISCLLGPNGAGKTTVIKILAGLVLPDGGEAFIFGVPQGKATKSSNAKVGIASPNERSFYWRLTGRQNLEFFGALHNLSLKERKQRADEVLDAAGFDEEAANRQYMFYSSGIRQKLLIARALIGRPQILLLDEPMNHLDPLAQIAMRKLIREVLVEKFHTTVLLSTHNLHEAEEMSDHLILLHKGRMLAEGSLGDLRSKLEQHYRISLEFAVLPSERWLDGLPATLLSSSNGRIEIALAEERYVPDIVQAALTQGGKLLSCTRCEQPLVEIFARLTQERSP